MKSLKFSYILYGLLLSLLLGTFSCGPKESIDPIWEARPIDDQLRQKPFEVSIPIDSLSVEEFGQEFGEVDELGPLFRELAGVFANVALEEGGQEFEIEPVIYYAPELNQVEDWNMVEKLSLKQIRLNIADAVDYELASLGFIRELRVYIDFIVPEVGQIDRQGRGLLVASYDKELDYKNLGCLDRCLELNIHDLAWKDILKEERTFVIYTELVVDSVPATEMKIGGSLDVSLGINVGL